MVWKIPEKEFSDNKSKVFSLKLIVLAFHLDGLKVLNKRLERMIMGKPEKEAGTKRERQELLRRKTNMYFSSGNLAQRR